MNTPATPQSAANDTDCQVCEQVMERNQELVDDKIALAERLEQVEQDNERLRDAARRARIYAGDNLTAAAGLVLVTILEEALSKPAD